MQLEASYSERFDPSRQIEESETGTVAGRVNVPIYDAGGEVYARVRQAKHTHVSRMQEIEQVRTEVRQSVIAAWSQMQAARAQLVSDQVQVDANRTALSGVREEEKVGQRTLLDVLDAEQELLNAEVTLATTRRNLIVASHNVLAAMGRLDSLTLGTVGQIYDPEQNYLETRRKWWGLSITHGDGRRETVDFWDSHGRHQPVK